MSSQSESESSVCQQKTRFLSGSIAVIFALTIAIAFQVLVYYPKNPLL
jgi:hypothetical protein